MMAIINILKPQLDAKGESFSSDSVGNDVRVEKIDAFQVHRNER